MRPNRFRSATLIAASALVGALVLVSSATLFTTDVSARPSTFRVAQAPPAPGEVTASVESSSPAIAVGAPFGFTATVQSGTPISYLQVRLKVFRPSGRLLFQRTRIENNVAAGVRPFHFERDTDDLELVPGAHRVEVEVVMQTADGRTEDVITTALLVYDTSAPPTDLVMVARVVGEPLSTTDGRFTMDPAREHQALDAVDRIVSASVDSSMPVTLAVAPMLLEEWTRISAGYEYSGSDGVVRAAAGDPVPARYAQVLDRLAGAVASGTVELLSTGYSDPGMSQLAAFGLAEDVGPQYQQGLSSSFASIESTPSTGTAPAGGFVPPVATTALAAEQIGYAVVPNGSLRRGDETATPGVYRAAETTLVVLACSTEAGAAAATGDMLTTFEQAFAQHVDSPGSPFGILGEIGPGTDWSAEAFVDAATTLADQPWLHPRLARDVASTGGAEVALAAGIKDRTAPALYWDRVLLGRRWARALTVSAGEALPVTISARTASLVAESSVWARSNWEQVERGRAYADAAADAGESVFKGVTISAQEITLAGTEGNVPVTITNAGDIPLTVRVTAAPQGNLKVTERAVREIQLKPQDNFFEVPVSLQNALNGGLVISIHAGDMLLSRKSVIVSASYLDRLVIIGAVVLLLAGMLAYIIRRVRYVESRNAVTADSGRYTDSTESEAARKEP